MPQLKTNRHSFLFHLIVQMWVGQLLFCFVTSGLGCSKHITPSLLPDKGDREEETQGKCVFRWK